MKKITVFTMFILGTFFGCGLNAQAPVDELGIKNEKDFVKFIKSLVVTENKVSENSVGTYYVKKIKIGDDEYTVEIDVNKTYGNDVYDGRIEIKIINKANSKYRDFRKSEFKFMTHEDVIIGKIKYFTGPGPYLSGSNIVQQFVNEKKAQNIENVKSVPNIYESAYLVKGEFVFVPGDVPNDKYWEPEDADEESHARIKKMKYEDSINVSKLHETERFTIVGAEAGENFKFYVTPTSYNNQELVSFKILSIVRLVNKADFWVNNGARDKWNYGYRLRLNPQKDNDTLSYAAYSPNFNGKLIDFKIVENEKVQMRTGEYKDGLQIGELVVYRLSGKGDFEKDKVTKIIESQMVNDLQGRPLKLTEYQKEVVYDKDGFKFNLNYPFRITNYDPITRRPNGLYQSYQLLKDYNVIDKSALSIPIIRETGNFLQGERVGEWNKFFDNGKLNIKINHTTGESETYDEQGKLLNKTFKKIQ